MRVSGGLKLILCVCLSAVAVRAEDTTLRVGDVRMQPGETMDVPVYGYIFGDPVIGVTVLAEIVPRDGTVGTVAFTDAPPADIMQLGDPWPSLGLFTAFDSDAPGFSTALNGSVDDNGTFLPDPLVFAGVLTGFPVTASVDARGEWDVVLKTSVGDSSWEGVSTVLAPGRIVVAPAVQVPSVSAWGVATLALLLLSAGTLVTHRRHRQSVHPD